MDFGVQKYSFIYYILCNKNVFFEKLPLISRHGFQISEHFCHQRKLCYEYQSQTKILSQLNNQLSKQFRQNFHWATEALQNHLCFIWNQIPGPIIIPGLEVAMATAWLSPPTPNPIMSRLNMTIIQRNWTLLDYITETETDMIPDWGWPFKQLKGCF